MAVDKLDEASVDAESEQIESEAVEGESGEVELVVAGQEGAPTSEASKPVDPKDHIIKRMQSKRDKANAEAEALREENAKLRAAMQGGQDNDYPTLAGCEYDEERLAREVAQWHAKNNQNIVNTVLKHQQSGSKEIARQKAEEQALASYAENASKLGAKDFNEAQDAALDVLGNDFGQMLARELPDKAPKLIYYFGKNPEEAAKFRGMFESSPGRTTFELGELAGQLTIKRKSSSAATPEDRLEGGSVADANAGDLQKRLEQVEKDVDSGKLSIAQSIRKVREIKKEIAQAG